MTCDSCQTTFKVGVVYEPNTVKRPKVFCFRCAGDVLRTVAPDLVRNYTDTLTRDLTDTVGRHVKRLLDGFKH